MTAPLSQRILVSVAVVVLFVHLIRQTITFFREPNP